MTGATNSDCVIRNDNAHPGRSKSLGEHSQQERRVCQRVFVESSIRRRPGSLRSALFATLSSAFAESSKTNRGGTLEVGLTQLQREHVRQWHREKWKRGRAKGRGLRRRARMTPRRDVFLRPTAVLTILQLTISGEWKISSFLKRDWV